MGEWLGTQFPDQSMLIATCAAVGCSILFFILSRVFRVIKSSKANNFYTHLVTWLLAVVIAMESLFTLFATKSVVISTSFEFTMARKIGIVAGGTLLLLHSILGPRIRRIVDRKI